MSVRKRVWRTGSGVEKEAWVIDYVDQRGKRHIKRFEKKKHADQGKLAEAERYLLA